MMREIIFRAKSIIGEKWRYGYYYQAKYYRYDTKLEHYITIPHPEIPNAPSDNFMIYPETLGQYTGLTDKNGKKVFEGDIIQRTVINKYHNYVVEFKNGEFQLRSTQTNGELFLHYVISGEVIGNIYDNSELIKELENNA